MSLSVYLTLPGAAIAVATDPAIWIREDGQNKQITRAEWDARFPDRDPVTFTPAAETDVVFEANITHNLGRMAEAAGLYAVCWEAQDRGWTTAAQLVLLLREGLARLRADPDAFLPLNPANGWGSYEGLVAFVEAYLAACEAYPAAQVRVHR